MLVLDRRIGETVKIADDVSVAVLGVSGRKVRLGFAASRTIPIHREEVYERLGQEQQATRLERSHVGATIQIKRARRVSMIPEPLRGYTGRNK